VSAPSAPVLVGTYDAGARVYSARLNGNYAIVGTGDGVDVVDVSDPSAPNRVGQCTLTDWAFDLHIASGLAYVANRGDFLSIVDISDPTAPSKIGSWKTAGCCTFGLAVSGRYVYLAEYNEGFDVIDAVNPKAPVQVGHLNGGGGRAIAVSGKTVYTTL